MLVTGKDGEPIGQKLVSYENVAEVLARGPTRTTVVLRSGIQVDLRVVPEESYVAALLYFTGSKAHNIALRGLANERGWKLNEYGLFAGKRRIAGATEEDVYKKLGLSLICPSCAKNSREVAAAQRHGRFDSLKHVFSSIVTRGRREMPDGRRHRQSEPQRHARDQVAEAQHAFFWRCHARLAIRNG